MKTIEILGANCGRCRAMEECARQAAHRLGLECAIMKVTDQLPAAPTSAFNRLNAGSVP